MAGMFIIAGVDKENKIIPNSLCIYELSVSIFYLIYKYIMNESIIENILGFIAFPTLLYILNKLIFCLKKDENKLPIGYGDIKYLAIIGLMFGFSIQILAIVLSSVISLFGVIINKYKEIPWGHYLTIATIILLIIYPYIKELIDLIQIRS